MESSRGNQLEFVVSKRSATSYQELLEAQNDLFQTQIEKLQKIVATQCKLTGVNPLSQEMAAGALSIKIGKRPRDLLNPKAVQYLQFVFSIKDAVSKRETREISAQFGVTASQVREFFTVQRSRVRNFVRLSGEKVDRSRTCDESHDGTPLTSYPFVSAEPVPIDTVAPNSHAGLSQLMHPEVVPLGKEKSDRHFMDNIFRLMRSEESFSGQVKLLEWILQIEKFSVLQWFLVEGGVMILATWLSQAAMEEQTSVLDIVLKVLCHLPLRKALPVHMSAILQSVNKLRFYRASDISNRARILLSTWSKMFASSQSSNKLNGNKSVGYAQDEMLLKQSIKEVMGNETGDSNVDYSEADLKIINGNANSFRKLESPQKLKLLTSSGEESYKRRGVMSSQMRERRKVKMVEPPGQRIVANSSHIVKSTHVTHSRPLSADDIQKTKMRTQFMQSKYIKSDDNSQVKSDSPHNCSTSQSNVLLQSIPIPVRPDLDERKELDNAVSKVSNIRETTRSNLEEPPWKKIKRTTIRWRTPREVNIKESWLVGSGESSKEIEVQKNRIRREREIIYRTVQEIPANPREPWDREMDYDDTLTLEIPIEQLPDVEPLETTQVSVNGCEGSVAAVSTTLCGGGSVPEPDLELLAELLKNPELVYALTSGQAGDLSSNETVKLLDMIKANGVTSLSNFAGLGAKGDNKVEVSLPSPTPSSDLVPNGVKRDLTRNPFSRQHTTAKGSVFQAPETAHIPGAPVFVTHPQPVSTLQSTIQPQQHTNIFMHNKSSNVHHLAPEMMLDPNTAINSNRTSPSLLRVENFGNVDKSAASLGISSTRRLPTPTSAPSHPQLPYTRESTSPHSLTRRFGYQTINYYQKSPTINNFCTGDPAHAAVPTGTCERNERAGRPEFESWSPENRSHRRHEYIPGQNYPEPRVNIRHERERQTHRNSAQSSGLRDQRMGGVRDYRR